MKVFLPVMQHDQAGFAALARLTAETKNCLLDDVEIDMGAATWLDADMCAAFGAVLYQLGKNLNAVHLLNIPPNVETILSKTDFSAITGGKHSPDRRGTTIPYQRFDLKDDRYFAGYIESELISRAEMPAMSSALLKKFRESIFEIFSNAVLHSRTRMGIFSCGQFFPKREWIDFSVADLGVGMRKNIQESMGLDFSAEEAICWATEGRNTTKRGTVPGGLGLKLLGEFIDLNDGSMQIVSDAGYWKRTKGTTIAAALEHPFPGTIVTLEINTADTNAYKLLSELNPEDIF